MPVRKQNCSGEFLDAGQYTINGILRYEKIFGRTFVSTGGLETTQEITSDLHLFLRPGMRVLDIGCGTGGSAFYLARKFHVDVLGLDLSDNMLSVARTHLEGMEPDVRSRVSFRKLDATKAEFPEGHFDLMYSRDAIMHIADKDLLYSRVYKWLKPGGRVLLSEYVNGFKYPNHSQEYIDYLIDRGYQLVTVKQYGDVLERAGFQEVDATDKTKEFVEVLKKEMSRFKDMREDFINEFSEKDYDDLMDGWKVKIERCREGEQGWGFFKGVKPV